MKTSTSTVAPDPVRDARQLYKTHREAASRESKVKNLDILWEALEGIRSDGGRDYSLAEVGRRLEVAGGLKTQSLRNAQGTHFREIISAYAEGGSGSTKYLSKSKSQVEAALELITDPSIRATLRMAIEEGKRLKVVNDNLHAAFKTLQVGASISATPTTDGQTQVNGPITQFHAVPPRLLRALKIGVDRTRLAERGMTVMEDGSITDAQGETLFPPSFVTAAEAFLAENSP
ncbi:gamma-mobile-trio protein GmtX [Polaromonas naphthalenivorans]|uniref:Uncharacterized protein n=1 Tax=Polaromonas naphthalenivorans (strain CJ2) TaxID=365044 RepID=A1VJW8_POLNA|nr:gamma-mobile-trio protein GmtX [Polaromonas naphthalenivorans]ABM35946.1 conserved hypothetical protein [Polaromonas naphthalenivorans CJ2]ABM39655.1 conserved hypothetical protein [Polaromonas naphthalenivorans CJ2]